MDDLQQGRLQELQHRHRRPQQHLFAAHEQLIPHPRNHLRGKGLGEQCEQPLHQICAHDVAQASVFTTAVALSCWQGFFWTHHLHSCGWIECSSKWSAKAGALRGGTLALSKCSPRFDNIAGHKISMMFCRSAG